MTMQSSGAISMGQARNECGQGNPVDAANGALSQLAGVGSGQGYAWSYWYGKTYVVPINNVTFAQPSVHVDRDGYLTINFRTGANSFSATGDNSPHLNSYNQTYGNVTMAQYYHSWSASITYIAGSTGVLLSVQQQPAPANDYTGIFHFDDNGPSGAHDVQVNINITFLP